MSHRLRLGVLISGSGRTLQNFIDLAQDGKLAAEVVTVVSSRTGVYGLERAEKAGVPNHVISRSEHANVESFSDALTRELLGAGVELVVLAGFLSLYRVPKVFEGRVMNIHPALLPSFGGKGFYGERVHKAVLEHGCKVSGVTVHFADNEYDSGPIIVQKAVPVLEGDDEHSLADRVFEAECEAYPEAINLFAAGRLRIDGRCVRVAPE